MRAGRALYALGLAAACLAPPALAVDPDGRVEAIGLDGRELVVVPAAPTVEAWLEAELAAARAKWALAESEQNAIWVGRRLAYMGRLGDAVAWYESALGRWPESFRLRRHLGHRLISLRRFDRAVEMLGEARRLAASQPNRIEPDGAPNRLGAPRSTTHGNIDYHLALAHYLIGDFAAAAELWRSYLDRWASNDDARVAGIHWLYTALTRAGRAEEAEQALTRLPAGAAAGWDVIENRAYADLCELYAGRRPAPSIDEALATTDAAFLYGLARFWIARGESESGARLLAEITHDTVWPAWAAFGAIAAEADLARTATPSPDR